MQSLAFCHLVGVKLVPIISVPALVEKRQHVFEQRFAREGQFPYVRLFEIPLIRSIRIGAIVLEGIDLECRHIAQISRNNGDHWG
jgi:hypothetical protein